MRSTRILAMLALGSLFAMSVTAEQRVLTVSPGEPERPLVIDGRCPSFSWSAVAGAESYELVVYEFSEESLSAAGAPALSRVLPGGALSWTPGRRDCLQAGRSFAWFVRAVDKGRRTEWSRERLFQTEPDPSRVGVAEALAVLQGYLSAGGSLEELATVAPAEQTSVKPVEAWVSEQGALPSASGEGNAVVPNSVPDRGMSSDIFIDGSLTSTSRRCPDGTFSVGAWCIGQEESERTYLDAWHNCWNQGKQICPLEALLACDHTQPAGADCTARTDDYGSIWCAEGYQATNDDIDIYADTGAAQIFAGKLSEVVFNRVDWHGMSSTHFSYCCTAR